MSEADYRQKLEELDRLLNDPTVPLNPNRIWVLLGEIARYSPLTLAKEGHHLLTRRLARLRDGPIRLQWVAPKSACAESIWNMDR